MRNITVTKAGDSYCVCLEGSFGWVANVVTNDKFAALGSSVAKYYDWTGISEEKMRELIYTGGCQDGVIGAMVYLRSELLGLDIVFKD